MGSSPEEEEVETFQRRPEMEAMFVSMRSSLLFWDLTRSQVLGTFPPLDLLWTVRELYDYGHCVTSTSCILAHQHVCSENVIQLDAVVQNTSRSFDH